jgi:hypothetical protein
MRNYGWGAPDFGIGIGGSPKKETSMADKDKPEIVEAVGIEGDDDNARLVVGRVVPRKGIAPDKWGRGDRRDIPHHLGIPEDLPVDPASRPNLAPRDKTEDWDMRRQGHPLRATEEAAVTSGQFEERLNAVSRDSRTLQERAGTDPWTGKPEEDQDEVELEGEDHEFTSRDGKNLDELAEVLASGEMLADIGGLKRRAEVLGQGADGGGKRLNAGKNRIELLPEVWLWALADVMTQGSKKYDARNWEKGMDWSSMIGCMHRHLAKFQAGQRYDGPKFDKELGSTGCHELAMVAWNALALMFYDLYGIGTNDLPTQPVNMFVRVNAETSDLAERIEEALK